jgi:hypothetical protein
MKIYYVDCYPKSNGFHLVHVQGCEELPNFINRKFLGRFDHINKAIKEAQKTYPNSVSCPHCNTDDKI